MALCRHFAAGTCRRGSSCTFSHDRRTSSSTSRRGTSSLSNFGRIRGTPGECHKFVTTGKCDFGHRCKFNHPERKLSQTPSSVSLDKDLGALASGVNSDALQNVATTWQAGEGKRIFTRLMEGDLFASTSEIYAFVNFLLASTKQSVGWSADASQVVLADVASPEGHLQARLRDILTWEKIDTQTSAASQTLSFQHAILPLFLYLTSRSVLNSTAKHHVNSLYAVLHANADEWSATTSTALKELMAATSVKNALFRPKAGQFDPNTMHQVFMPLYQMLHRYLVTFDKALAQHSAVRDLIASLNEAFGKFARDLVLDAPSFDTDWLVTEEPLVARRYIVDGVEKVARQLSAVQTLHQRQLGIASTTVDMPGSFPTLPVVNNMFYDPPGALRPGGPRHSNDHANIRDIRVLPSHDEIVCAIQPFLPKNLPTAMHPLPSGSMERRLDILFRLLREDIFRPISLAIRALLLELQSENPQYRQQITQFIARGGGYWRAPGENEAAPIMIYPGVDIYDLAFDIAEKDENGRSEPVKHTELQAHLHFMPRNKVLKTSGHSNRLASGALIGLLLPVGRVDYQAFLGTVVKDAHTRTDDDNRSHAYLTITFYDPKAYLAIINGQTQATHRQAVLLEVPNFLLGTVQPFLARLQTMDPTSIPFQDIIAASTGANFQPDRVMPPRYALDPQFTYQLDCLLGDDDHLAMYAGNEESIAHARRELQARSSLDESQANALIDTLIREVVMIEGPPGTGKSWVGVKIINTLLQNKIGPILIMCYTNHALDQFLEHLLDIGIENIVRCGSRSKSPRVAQHALFELLQKHKGEQSSAFKRQIADEHRHREEIQEQINSACAGLARAKGGRVEWSAIAQFLKTSYHDVYEELMQPPDDLSELRDMYLESKAWGDTPGWQKKTSKKEKRKADQAVNVIDKYAPSQAPWVWWQSAADFQLQEATMAFFDKTTFDFEELENNSADSAIFDSDENETPSWQRPCTNRSIEVLIDEGNVWSFSTDERKTLLDFLVAKMVDEALPRLDRLQKAHEKSLAAIGALRGQAKLELLKSASIIGCTTNGAANLLNVLTSVGPRVMMVEEAGECLESQVLANLVPSLEHLILIGDHKQLRPTIASHHLSVDSVPGTEYRLDESLFERLVRARVPFSVLQTQRRMRPEISSLIRAPLYPELLDHETVCAYPPLKGVSKSVVFFSHTQAEDRQASDTTSRSNTFEAEMLCDLAVHFVKQGYRKIALLAAYLGQVQLIKRLLANRRIMVELDDRDIAQLQARGLSDDSPQVSSMNVSDIVTLRTADNFQGEEAEVVLLSLVRNVPQAGKKATIGFLKSPNRANVALSRAQHGMIVLGNADLLREGSSMWASVLTTLDEQQAVMDGIPLVCARHPEAPTTFANRPGMIEKLSPEGGCLKTCSAPLKCGHDCARLCHPDDLEHKRAQCAQPCSVKLECGHPCPNECSAPCGKCTVPLFNTELPCGHIASKIDCYQSLDLSLVTCRENVTSILPCGHRLVHKCGQEVERLACDKRCGAALPCAHATCQRPCAACSKVADESLRHPHDCGKPLACGHNCAGDCRKHLEDGCGTCTLRCSKRCEHGHCSHPCAEGPCRSCASDCQWECEHQGRCPDPCSMPCSRLQCDLKCEKMLACGHRCHAPCGEDCSKQICPECASPEKRTAVVDLLCHETLEEVVKNDEIVITLDCGHIFTMESLDGHLAFSTFYSEAGELNALTQAEIKDKSCPSCRQPITGVKRYGRPLKCADLARQERIALSLGKRQLADIAARLDAASTDAIAIRERLPEPAPNAAPTIKVVKQYQRKLLRSPAFGTDGEAIAELAPHGLSHELGAEWKTRAGGLLRLYNSGLLLARTNTPSLKVWDAAYNKHYRAEHTRLLQSPETSLSRPLDELASEFATRKVGIPPPRVAEMCKLEALQQTLMIRAALMDVGEQLLEDVSGEKDKGRLPHFLTFLASTSLRDCDQAADLATQAKLVAKILNIELIRYETAFRKDKIKSMKELRVDGKDVNQQARERIAKESDKTRAAAAAVFAAAIRAYESTFNDLGGTALGTKIRLAQRSIGKKWDALKLSILQATRYEEVSAEERAAIIRAVANSSGTVWASSAHWYTCPNGHAYIITECGQAMQESRCAECGARVGGGSHQLRGDNRIAADFDRDHRLALGYGAERQ